MPLIELSEEVIAALKVALGVCSAAGTTPVLPPAGSPTPLPSTADSWVWSAHDIARTKGFSKAILYDWDWSKGGITIDTQDRGFVGPSGVFIASFVPDGPETFNNLAQIDAIGYPSPNQGNQLLMTLSESPCDFDLPEPARSCSIAPSIVYGVGTVALRWSDKMPTAVALTAGKRYYINVTGRFSYEPSKFGGPEFRVAMRKS